MSQNMFVGEGLIVGKGLLNWRILVEVTVLYTCYYDCHNYFTFLFQKSIRLSLCALFHISNREHGMELILTTVHQNSLQNFLFDLIRCIQVEEWACFKYALLILHNLMTDKSVGKEVVEYSRKQKAMSVIIDWLGDRNEKLLSVTVDILQLLCDKNREQKVRE